MQEKFFSIIVVALNPGERLKATLESIVSQTFEDYEVILKDGGSRDGSLERLQEEGFLDRYPQLRLVRQEDRGIYEGMNQALSVARGRFLYFLNCGDYLAKETVLEQVAGRIRQEEASGAAPGPFIYYGNQYNRKEGMVVVSAPKINDFTCYRNVPCHQVCFYAGELFRERAYDLRYRVRADYEHFLYCIYEKKAKAISMDLVVASYEGGGFSETKENRACSAREHAGITQRYLGKAKVRKYRCIMWLTLAPVRTRIAETPALAGAYNGVKRGIYKILGRN